MDPYESSSTLGEMGGMKSIGRAMGPMLNDVYERVASEYPVESPRPSAQYIPPHLRRQVTAEQLDMKRDEFEMNRAEALMLNEQSRLNYAIKSSQQIGPATEALYGVDPSSPDAFNQIREIQKMYPLAFQDNDFLRSTVNPLMDIHKQYMEDIPKPKTEDEVMEDIIKLRAKQQEMLNMFNAKNLDDLRRKGDPVDVRLYERLNRQIDAMMGVGGGDGGGGALDALDMLTGGTGTARPSSSSTTSISSPSASGFSGTNPYAGQVSAQPTTVMPPGAAPSATPTRSTPQRMQAAQERLNEINKEIANIDNMRVGRRPASSKEKAERWERLTAEKSRLEEMLGE